MINEENLNKMYNGLIDESKLTTKELNSYGFNSNDLTNLINDGVLERIKRGYYSFLSIDDLYYYGKHLISLKEYDKATACFKKCYELDPNHLGACFQLFLRAVQSKNYEEAFTYFDYFYDSDNAYYNNDNNFYLYLLSMITEIPEKHREYAKYLNLEDVRVDPNDKRYKDHYSQNKVRIYALNQKFISASKQLNELIKQQGRLSVQDIITRTLLSQAIEVQKNLKQNIINLTKEKKYEEVIACLEKVQEKHCLTAADECILLLAREISKLEETAIIPKKEIASTNKLFEAINGKNFVLALKIAKTYSEKIGQRVEDNVIYQMLEKIQNEIENIKSNNKCKSNNEPIKEEIIDIDKYKRLVNDRLYQLHKAGIVLLDPMNNIERKQIHKIVDAMSEVTSFSIGKDSSRRVVLRFKPHQDEYVNVSQTLKEGKEAYDAGNLDLCIKKYRKVLEVGKPNSLGYAKLGLAYMKKGKRNIAINYLTVANELSLKENKDYDYSDLIMSLKSFVKKSNRKPYFKMTTDEFKNDINDNYGIENINEIETAIEAGIMPDDAYNMFKLDSEQINLVNLIFARKFYATENYILGDKYFGKVEKQKNKSKFVNSLVDEVRKNKRFYKNRNIGEDKKLVLSSNKK